MSSSVVTAGDDVFFLLVLVLNETLSLFDLVDVLAFRIMAFLLLSVLICLLESICCWLLILTKAGISSGSLVVEVMLLM